MDGAMFDKVVPLKGCDLCEKQFNNLSDFNRHMKSHLYKEAKFQCEDWEKL